MDSKDVVWRYQAPNNNCRVMKRYVTNLAFELIIPLGGVESDILMCTKVYHKNVRQSVSNTKDHEGLCITKRLHLSILPSYTESLLQSLKTKLSRLDGCQCKIMLLTKSIATENVRSS